MLYLCIAAAVLWITVLIIGLSSIILAKIGRIQDNHDVLSDELSHLRDNEIKRNRQIVSSTMGLQGIVLENVILTLDIAEDLYNRTEKYEKNIHIGLVRELMTETKKKIDQYLDQNL